MKTFSFWVSNMRRKDREITDFDKILQVIDSCDCFRLGLIDEDNLPYIVPLNFAYEVTDGAISLYFHGSKSGKKADILKTTQKASFEMDTGHELKVGNDNPSSYSYYYECVMGKGEVVALDSYEDKVNAFKLIMKKYAHRDDFSFPKIMMKAVAVYEITVTEFSCKVHAKP